MYVKLAVGSTSVHPHDCIRDIGRLLTSPSPNVANLTGLAYSTTFSVVVDSTPAGWSYVGSNFANDTPTISTGGTYYQGTGVSGLPQLVFSASCLNSNALKYAVLTQSLAANTANVITWYSIGHLTGAASANSTGGPVGEGPRIYDTGVTTGSGSLSASSLHLGYAGSIIHLIANPRHITIISEPGTGTVNGGLNAIWESSQTDAHTFYNIAPYVQYSHANSFVSGSSISSNTTPNTSTTVTTLYHPPVIFNAYNATTGSYANNYDVSVGGTQNRNYLTQYGGAANTKNNTINTIGISKAIAQPVFYHASALGYPIQMVTGVVPVYWMRGNIGSSGDTVYINGNPYTYFNCGGFALAMTTGN